MFDECYQFNSDISNWDVGGCYCFDGMFSGCSMFNQDLSSWNVINGRSFQEMFLDCTDLQYEDKMKKTWLKRYKHVFSTYLKDIGL